MGTCILKQRVQAGFFKMSSIFVWTACLVVALTTAGLSEASAGFTVSPPTLAYIGTVGGPNQAHGVTVTNTGSTVLTVTWADSLNWLVLIQPGFTQTIQPGQSGTFTLTASTAGLTAGAYNGTATITGAGSTKQVPISMTVTSGSTTPAIGLSPTSLAFTGSVGGANPVAQSLNIANTGGGTLSWSAGEQANWLTLSPPSGTNAGTITVSVNLIGLSAGTYTGAVTVSGVGAVAKTVPVTLTVAQSTSTSGFNISPPTLAYTGTVGGPNQAHGVTVTNTGSTVLTVTWADSLNWLVLIQPGFTQTIQPGQSGTFTLTASTAGLTAGAYNGTATITGAGSTKQVPISMTVTSGSTTPVIGLSPTSLAFTGSVGGANPVAQSLNIANTGGGTLSWSASDNAPWLTVSPASGSGPGVATVNANTAGLAAGTLNGTITVAAAGAPATSIPVSLTVTPATSTKGFSVSPSTLAYTGTVGGPNWPGSFSVTNTGTTALTVTYADSISWLVGIQPGLSQTIQPGQSGTFTITASSAGLAAGTYSGTGTLTGGGLTKQLPITLTLSPASGPVIGLAPASLAFTGSVGGANPVAQSLNIANTGGGTLSWSASDNAPWLTVSPASGSGPGVATVSVNTAGLAAGTLNGTITVAAAGAPAKSIPVSLTVTAASTGAATLNWNASTSSDAAGYKVYKATASGAYGAPLATLQGKVLSYQAIGLQINTTYFFVVTSYDSAGNESLHSNEVSKSIF